MSTVPDAWWSPSSPGMQRLSWKVSRDSNLAPCPGLGGGSAMPDGPDWLLGSTDRPVPSLPSVSPARSASPAPQVSPCPVRRHQPAGVVPCMALRWPSGCRDELPWGRPAPSSWAGSRLLFSACRPCGDRTGQQARGRMALGLLEQAGEGTANAPGEAGHVDRAHGNDVTAVMPKREKVDGFLGGDGRRWAGELGDGAPESGPSGLLSHGMQKPRGLTSMVGRCTSPVNGPCPSAGTQGTLASLFLELEPALHAVHAVQDGRQGGKQRAA